MSTLIQSYTNLVLLALVLLMAGLCLGLRLTPAPVRARRRNVRVIRHEIVFVGGAAKIDAAPAWLGERIMSGRVMNSGDVVRFNGETISLAPATFPAGAKVALHLVRE